MSAGEESPPDLQAAGLDPGVQSPSAVRDATAPRVRPLARVAPSAFRSMLVRDFTVLDRTIAEFLPRTIIQPLLLVFVFTYVFPKIGQQVAGPPGEPPFSTLLVAGVVGFSIVIQCVQSVALPLVRDFGVLKEIEDRVLAPMPLSMLALEKAVAGALQGLLAAALVFPIATWVPAEPVFFQVDWPVLVTLAPLASFTAAALGLMLGTMFKPRTISVMVSTVLLPMTFLGAVYYPWARLDAIPWLQVLVLVNPLVYMNEGFRAALLTGVPHMPLAGVYGGLCTSALILFALGIRGFRRRVLT